MERFPPFASLAPAEGTRRPGHSVADATAILHRLAYVKQRLAIAAAAYLPSIPEWEAKCALALHGWLDAEHAEQLYSRIAELREPPPGAKDVPDARLEAALDEMFAAGDTRGRIAAVHGVVRPLFRSAVADYLRGTNPLCDQPSTRVLTAIQHEEEVIGRWGDAAAASVASSPEAIDWTGHLGAWVEAAGGVDGRRPAGNSPPARFSRPYRFAVLPRRDERFAGLFDPSTPADLVYLDETRDADERNAALMFKRLREMDVPELIAGIIAEHWAEERNARPAEPRKWTYYTAMFRQMWDEARHAMLGQALMESRGIDWTTLPVNVTFSWKLARHCSPLERHILLYAIEQSLMPRDRGKPYEHRVAAASGDPLSALFHDFDWADEVLHVDIARRCLKPELPGGLAEARQRADALWSRIAERLAADPLPADGDPRAVRDWWPRFARSVLGRDVAPVPDTDVKNWRPIE